MIFREVGRGEERETSTSCLPHALSPTPTGDRAGNLSVHWTKPSQLSHIDQGLTLFFTGWTVIVFPHYSYNVNLEFGLLFLGVEIFLNLWFYLIDTRFKKKCWNWAKVYKTSFSLKVTFEVWFMHPYMGSYLWWFKWRVFLYTVYPVWISQW